jgi:uncharacterized protein
MVIANVPIVTANSAAVLGLMQVGLMMWTAAGRGTYSTGLGDGGNEALLRRIRIHGNLAENVPIFLILLGLVEVSGDWPIAVPVIAVSFIIVRVLHAVGLSRSSGTSVPRFIGAVGTATAIGLLALFLIGSAIVRSGSG